MSSDPFERWWWPVDQCNVLLVSQLSSFEGFMSFTSPLCRIVTTLSHSSKTLGLSRGGWWAINLGLESSLVRFVTRIPHFHRGTIKFKLSVLNAA